MTSPIRLLQESSRSSRDGFLLRIRCCWSRSFRALNMLTPLPRADRLCFLISVDDMMTHDALEFVRINFKGRLGYLHGS